MQIGLISLLVDDYDPAVEFFVGTLGFDLVEDSSCGRRARSRTGVWRCSSTWPATAGIL
ncbi:MAG TPA: VOC family protein [Acidimicrobiales bacterium]|nr:VOC family protein [Acidimicrobiales bacterium]